MSRPSVSATEHHSQPLHLRVALQLIPFAPVRPATAKRHNDLTPLKAWLLRPPSPWLPAAPRLRLRLSMSRQMPPDWVLAMHQLVATFHTACQPLCLKIVNRN